MFANIIAGWNRLTSWAVHPRPRPEQEDGKPQPPFPRQPLEHVKQRGKPSYSPFWGSRLNEEARLKTRRALDRQTIPMMKIAVTQP